VCVCFKPKKKERKSIVKRLWMTKYLNVHKWIGQNPSSTSILFPSQNTKKHKKNTKTTTLTYRK